VGDAVSQAIVDALWAKIAARFDDDDAHQAFLKHCHEADRLVEAAARYRRLKDDLDEDDPLRPAIDKRLAAVALVAMAQLEREREPANHNAARWLTVVVVVFTLAAVVGLIRALLI
jgi:hypothetical protein